MSEIKRFKIGDVNFIQTQSGFSVGHSGYHLTVCLNVHTGLFDIHLTKEGLVNEPIVRKTFTPEQVEKFSAEFGFKMYNLIRHQLKRVKVKELFDKGYFITTMNETRFEEALKSNSPIVGKKKKAKYLINWKRTMMSMMNDGPGWLRFPSYLNTDDARKNKGLILAQSFQRKQKWETLTLINLPSQNGWDRWYSLPYDLIPKLSRSLLSKEAWKEMQDFFDKVVENISFGSLESEFDLSEAFAEGHVFNSSIFEHMDHSPRL